MTFDDNKYINVEKADNKKDKTDYGFGIPPQTQPSPPFLYNKKQKPNDLYTYKNINGEIEFVIFRDNTKVEKQIKPYSYSRAIKGWVNKLPKIFEGNKNYKRTLYKAEVLGDTIAQEERTKSQDLCEVIICEGEKACISAENIFSQPIILSWSNGTRSINKSDWSIIKDRKVYLWPDNDKEGFEAMLKIGKILSKLNEVYWVEIPDDFPLKWDLADPVPKSYEGELQDLLDKSEHWIKAKDKVDTKKFDLLNPLNFVWIEESMEMFIINEDVYRNEKQIKARYRKHNKNAFNHLLEKGCRIVDSTAFYPKRPPIFKHEGKRLLNAWKPSKIMGVNKDITWWKKDLDRFFRKDDEEQHYYNQVIAHLIQHPDKKLPFCHHKGGIQGNGKSQKDLVVAGIVGMENTIVIDNETLKSSFNDYLINHLVVFIEELNVSAKEKADMMNRLKNPIVLEKHVINKKMVPTFKHYCPTRWFSNSNHITPVYLETSDRRFAMYWSDSPKWEKDYVKEMLTHTQNPDDLEGVKYFYQQYSLKDFDNTHPRMNGYKQSLIVNTEKKLYTYLDNHYEEHTGPFKHDNIDLINVKDLDRHIKSDPQVWNHSTSRPFDSQFYCSETEVFNWAISRGGRALTKKSVRTKLGKKNLIAMKNIERWNNEGEGSIKDYYTPPTHSKHADIC